jgi:lipopolysaccharide biosynthesis glycosyltransferase
MQPIPVFIGHDRVESVAFWTLANSIQRNASYPVSITPISLTNLKGIYNRPRDPKQSNEFSFSRFLVPYLTGYTGHAIFMDCDMLCRGDITELYGLRSYEHAVQVVKHDYTPKDDTKFLGATQYRYPKKNWSSVMLFNNQHYHTRALTPERVNTAPGLELHQFKWKYSVLEKCAEDTPVGDLPAEWNHLVGEYHHNPNAKLVHYTVGGPYFNEYQNCDYSDEWREEYHRMIHCEQLPIPMLKVSQK